MCKNRRVTHASSGATSEYPVTLFKLTCAGAVSIVIQWGANKWPGILEFQA